MRSNQSAGNRWLIVVFSLKLIFESAVAAVLNGPPWIVDLVKQSTPNSTDTATYVDQSLYGSVNFGFARGLPAPYDELFTSVMYVSNKMFDDIRLYSIKGEALLNISSGGSGLGSLILKKTPVYSLMTCTWFSWLEPNFLAIHPISINAGVFASTGAPITLNDKRIVMVTDDPTTDYFFATALIKLHKYSAVDGSWISESPYIGNQTEYPLLTALVPVFDCAFVWFKSNSRAALIDRSSMGLIASSDSNADKKFSVIQDNNDPTILWNLWNFGGSDNVMQKRVISTGTDVLLVTDTCPKNFLFFTGSLAQIPTLQLIVVIPYHVDFWTPMNLRGTIYFVRTATLDVVQFSPSNNWLLQRSAFDFSNPVAEDGGRRFYWLYADFTTQNIHSYYFLMDTCMDFGTSSLSCMQCPQNYWRASASFPAPRKCLSPNDFPSNVGMKNDTGTYEPCQTADCNSCTFDYTDCVSCDSSNGFYLLSSATPKVCLQKINFASGTGLDAVSQTILPCSSAHCVDCKDNFEVCVQCDSPSGWLLSGVVCVNTADLPLKQGPNVLQGTVVPCQNVHCLNCSVNYWECLNCEISKKWYLDVDRKDCKHFSQFLPNQGIDLDKLTVVPCADPLCSNCTQDHRVCQECSRSGLYILNGVCRPLSGGAPPKLKSVRYYALNSTADIEFNVPVLVNHTGNFWDTFSLSIEDQANNKTYFCNQLTSGTADFECISVLLGNTIRILFNTQVQLTSARALLYAKIAGMSSNSGLILSRLTNDPFLEYPIVLDYFNTEQDSVLLATAGLVSASNSFKPYLGALNAILSLTLSVTFDKYMVNFEYLALLTGPVKFHLQSSTLYEWDSQYWYFLSNCSTMYSRCLTFCPWI